MQLFALDPWWNDFYTVAGFVIDILGLIVGVGGFWIAIHQIRETKFAAEAAEGAAMKTLNESKEAYERFVGAFASRLFSELQDAVNEADWKIANVRSHDFAELLGTLPETGIVALDDATRTGGASLREFAQVFAGYYGAKKAALPAKLLKERWLPLLQLLHRRLDQLRAPFRENNDGQIGFRDPTGEIPNDRHKPTGQNESGTGELDPRRGEDPGA